MRIHSVNPLNPVHPVVDFVAVLVSGYPRKPIFRQDLLDAVDGEDEETLRVPDPTNCIQLSTFTLQLSTT
jgi:hypothetical protein